MEEALRESVSALADKENDPVRREEALRIVRHFLEQCDISVYVAHAVRLAEVLVTYCEQQRAKCLELQTGSQARHRAATGVVCLAWLAHCPETALAIGKAKGMLWMMHWLGRFMTSFLGDGICSVSHTRDRSN
jgi:hypothetical protein